MEDQRIVVSLSLSHIKGRLEGIKRKAARQYDHEDVSVAEIREFVQDVCYAAIDDLIKPQPTNFYVKLGEDGTPTGEFMMDQQFWNGHALAHPDEQWTTISALDIDELQAKMKAFSVPQCEDEE